MSKRSTSWRSLFTSGALVVCAVVLTAANVRRALSSPLSKPLEMVGDWQRYGESGQRLGPAAASVTVTVWSDYQCAFCRHLDEKLARIRADLGDQVQVVWRHFPIPAHPHARAGAAGAICAGEQGAFERFHHALFERDGVPGQSWIAFAATSGVRDTAAFAKCLESDVPGRAIATDSAAARRLGAAGTPNILVNGARYQGVPRDLDRIVRHALRVE